MVILFVLSVIETEQIKYVHSQIEIVYMLSLSML